MKHNEKAVEDVARYLSNYPTYESQAVAVLDAMVPPEFGNKIPDPTYMNDRDYEHIHDHWWNIMCGTANLGGEK